MNMRSSYPVALLLAAAGCSADSSTAPEMDASPSPQETRVATSTVELAAVQAVIDDLLTRVVPTLPGIEKDDLKGIAAALRASSHEAAQGNLGNLRRSFADADKALASYRASAEKVDDSAADLDVIHTTLELLDGLLAGAGVQR